MIFTIKGGMANPNPRPKMSPVDAIAVATEISSDLNQRFVNTPALLAINDHDNCEII